MDDLFKTLKKKLKKFLEFFEDNPHLSKYFKFSLALSTVTLFAYFLYPKRKQKLVLSLKPNIGYLRLIKPDINAYESFIYKFQEAGGLKDSKSSFSKFFKYVKKFYAIPNGITNYGNNCYINVLLQCLASNPDFMLFIKNFSEYEGKQKLSSRELEIAKEISEILEQINSGNSVVSAYNLVCNLNNKYQFEFEQQDSYELYHRLLDLFDDNLVRNKSNNQQELSNPFLIEFESSLKCEKCDNLLKKKEFFTDISLYPDKYNYCISSMLKKFFYNRITDYTCSKCTIVNIIDQIKIILSYKYEKTFVILRDFLLEISKGNVDDEIEKINSKIENFSSEKGIYEILKRLKLQPIKTTLSKTLEIKKFPKILTIHVNKVFYDDIVYTNKFNITFPEILKLKKDKLGTETVTYELSSFIEHFGYHNFGHYIAYRKFHDNWVFINDSKATLIEKEKVFKVPNPYILFYRISED